MEIKGEKLPGYIFLNLFFQMKSLIGVYETMSSRIVTYWRVWGIIWRRSWNLRTRASPCTSSQSSHFWRWLCGIIEISINEHWSIEIMVIKISLYHWKYLSFVIIIDHVRRSGRRTIVEVNTLSFFRRIWQCSLKHSTQRSMAIYPIRMALWGRRRKLTLVLIKKHWMMWGVRNGW